MADGQKYYQFTAKDECTRWTYREMYEEHSTHSAWQFLLNLVRKAPFPIRMIQTDNGTEFTNALLVTKSKHKTLFETALLEMGIAYHRIQIATPRHNGKVERQHRTDELRFYRHMRMYSLEGIYQLKIAHADVSALPREIFRYLFVLLLRYLHDSIIPDIHLLSIM